MNGETCPRCRRQNGYPIPTTIRQGKGMVFVCRDCGHRWQKRKIQRGMVGGWGIYGIGLIVGILIGLHGFFKAAFGSFSNPLIIIYLVIFAVFTFLIHKILRFRLFYAIALSFFLSTLTYFLIEPKIGTFILEAKTKVLPPIIAIYQKVRELIERLLLSRFSS